MFFRKLNIDSSSEFRNFMKRMSKNIIQILQKVEK